MNKFFEETFIDPFKRVTPFPRLVNIGTGTMVSYKYETCLLNIHNEDETDLQTFIDERFVISEGISELLKSFFDPMAKGKFATGKQKNIS